MLTRVFLACSVLCLALPGPQVRAEDKKPAEAPPQPFIPTVILRPTEKITFLLSPLPFGRTAIDFDGLPAGVRGEIDGDLANDLRDKYKLDLLCVRLVATAAAQPGEAVAKVVAIPFDSKNPPYSSAFRLIVVQ